MRMLELQTNNSELLISKLVLGTDYFGTNVSKNMSFRLMDMFADAGGNCLDTARVYACWLPDGNGASEKTIGQWLKEKKNRSKILISTKGGHPPIDHMTEGRLSKKELQFDIEESLKALGTDYIDIYWLHRDDLGVPVEEIIDILNEFISSGKIRAIGASNWSSGRIQEANKYAKSRSLAQFMASQIQWSLATSSPEAHADKTIICMNEGDYSWYNSNHFPVMAFSSQAKGFFTKAIKNGLENLSPKAYNRFNTPENIERLERVKTFAAENGLTPTQTAIAYITCNAVPAMAIIGCKNEEQLADSLSAGNVNISCTDANWLFMGK